MEIYQDNAKLVYLCNLDLQPVKVCLKIRFLLNKTFFGRIRGLLGVSGGCRVPYGTWRKVQTAGSRVSAVRRESVSDSEATETSTPAAMRGDVKRAILPAATSDWNKHAASRMFRGLKA